MFLPRFTKNSLNIISNLSTNNIISTIKNVPHATQRIAPYTTVLSGFIIENAPKKADYAKDLLFMYNKGIPVKTLSEMYGISISYIYELLKK